jgi:hypothetical protein
VVPLLRAQGGEEESQFGLVVSEDIRATDCVLYAVMCAEKQNLPQGTSHPPCVVKTGVRNRVRTLHSCAPRAF